MKKTLWPDASLLNSKATDHQREQWSIATSRPYGILGGHPGTGKSQLTAWGIKLLVEQYGQNDIAVCAPTGKAAVRITELMKENDIDLIATTIHRTLGVLRYKDGNWGFNYNSSNPFPFRFLICDEKSMEGTALACSRFSACKAGMHVLDIGDFNQLPPVEHGAPLRDSRLAGVPYGELSEVHRYTGDVTEALREIRDRGTPKPSSAFGSDKNSNWLHLETCTGKMSQAALASRLKESMPGIDKIWDIQVLCTVNDSTPVSRSVLNHGLQNILNKDGFRIKDSKFRVEDKVICRSNGYITVTTCDICGDSGLPNPKKYSSILCKNCSYERPLSTCDQEFIANGEIGRVIHLEPGVIYVSFDSPKKTVRVAGEWLDQFELAYAITTHLAQGSQTKHIISMIDDSWPGNWVGSRELWHTSLSRMQEDVVTIGSLRAMREQCKKSSLECRKTFLTEKIRNKIK